MITRIILLFSLILHGTSLISQVTIGSAEKPVGGAILQLSNFAVYTDGEANANKGLGLPRVQLIRPTELYPMFTDASPEYNTDEKRKAQKEAHVGMLVYTPEIWSDNYCPGLYVWNGEEWDAISERKSLQQSSFVDGEGNTYNYARFGDVDWTTTNMMTTRVKGKMDGEKLVDVDSSGKKYKLHINIADDFIQGVPFNFETRDELISYGVQKYKMNGDIIEIPMLDYVSKFGILYTYDQALQACPEGWSLPTKEDFDTMYKFIQSHFNLTAEEAAISMRNDKSTYETILDGQKEDWAGVDICDPDIINSGFNAVPSGAFHGSTASTEIYSSRSSDFGAFAFWWFNNETTTPIKRYSLGKKYPVLTLLSSAGGNIDPSRHMGYSVRCIRK